MSEELNLNSNFTKWSCQLAVASFVIAAAVGCDTKPASDTSTTTSTTKTTDTTTTPTTTAARPASTGPGNTASGDKIPIGVVASLTGDNLPWGKDCVAGAQLAVDEFNKAGGLKGKQVTLIPSDDASKPEQGKSATEKLVGDDKVVAVIGEVSSGITKQMGPVCQDQGVPDVAVGATNPDITKLGDCMFRVCYTDDVQGPVMATFAYKKLGLHKVAMMTDKTQIYSVGLSNSFRKAFTDMGGQIVDEEFYESKQPQFTSQLTNLKAKGPEGVFASGYFNEVGPIVRQAKEAGISVPFFGGDGWDSKEIINTGGSAILGDYYCNHYVNDDTRPQVQDFLKKWKTLTGTVPGTAMGALGYDATALVLDALKRSKSLNSKDIRDAIADTENFAGVTGDITLKGRDGNPPKRAIIVKLTKDGTVFADAIDRKDLTK